MERYNIRVLHGVRPRAPDPPFRAVRPGMDALYRRLFELWKEANYRLEILFPGVVKKVDPRLRYLASSLWPLGEFIQPWAH